jgi:hypothetical protein
MAHSRLGQAAEARRWLEKAVAAKPAPEGDFTWERLEASLLLAEAEAVVASGAAPGSP